MSNIYEKISEARERSDRFDQFVGLCESRIDCWKDELLAKNDIPCTVFINKTYAPASTKISILLPVVPLSPNETKLLLEYLAEKYRGSYDGDYFTLKKCLFRNNYKLSSHEGAWRNCED